MKVKKFGKHFLNINSGGLAPALFLMSVRNVDLTYVSEEDEKKSKDAKSHGYWQVGDHLVRPDLQFFVGTDFLRLHPRWKTLFEVLGHLWAFIVILGLSSQVVIHVCFN